MVSGSIQSSFVQPMYDSEDDFPILELILRNYMKNEDDIQRIRSAYLFAREAHKTRNVKAAIPILRTRSESLKSWLSTSWMPTPLWQACSMMSSKIVGARSII